MKREMSMFFLQQGKIIETTSQVKKYNYHNNSNKYWPKYQLLELSENKLGKLVKPFNVSNPRR